MVSEGLKALFFPGRCPVCDGLLRIGGDIICEECKTRVEAIGETVCLKCGKPVEEEQEYCGDCKGRSRSFCYGRSLFLYDAVMRRSVSRFKYQGRREYAAYFGREMARRYIGWTEQINPEGLIPVPLHKSRQKKRGYNQAALVAEVFGEYCHIPVYHNFLCRKKNTKALKTLDTWERKENLEGAFAISEAFEVLSEKIKCVILIDDIYTTGSTIDSCSRVLQAAGIHQIYFLCVCTGQGY